MTQGRSLIPERSPEDIAYGIARVELGGEVYSLPALPWSESDAWLLRIDARMASLVSALEDAGNDTDAIVTRLAAEPEALFDALYEYDTSGVLPAPAELKSRATKNDVLLAVLGVWRAANPLVDIALSEMVATATASLDYLRRSSTPPGPTAGPPDTSSSTRPRNGSSRTPKPRTNGTSKSSSNGSTPLDSAGSSRTTTRRTGGGGGKSSRAPVPGRSPAPLSKLP